jgi:formate hydrogenlyase transcriptional activator
MSRHVEAGSRDIELGLRLLVEFLGVVIDRALILSTGSALHLEEMMNAPARGPGGRPALERLDDVQRAHIRGVLEGCGWKIDGKGHAADKLGLNPSTLRSWMERLGITRPPRRV